MQLFTKTVNNIPNRRQFGQRYRRPNIVKYHQPTTLNKEDQTDETAWCSLFVNYCFTAAKIKEQIVLSH